MQKLLVILLIGGMMIFLSCASDDSFQDDEFVAFAHRYIERYLELNPETATTLGDHRYDERLDDYSTAGVSERLNFNTEALTEIGRIDPDRLSEANAIDYAILRNRIEAAIFRSKTLREHEWNPLVYNVGGAIYSLISRDFAPLEERMASARKRLEQIPQVTAMAKANLKNPPRVHTETAILQNKGAISLIRDQLDTLVDTIPSFAEELRPAQEKAVAALEYYGSWLEKDLLPISNGDFRLGEEKFRQKLRYVLDSNLTMEDILRRAERDLVDTQEAMFETALALHRQHFPSEKIDVESADKKKTIKRILDALSSERPTNDSILDLARATLSSCADFAAEKNLVSVPDEPLELIVMPEFQRGVAVAYCDAPGPLEPDAKTFYAISPTPSNWSEERTESFFREYNNHMLHDLTIHEAVPGHYLQLAHSNRFDAPTMIRPIFYSGSFVEGWATYAEQLMAERGYGGNEVKIQQQKMRLRMIINAIIDQKIHTAGMTEEEAMVLMTREGFQEEGEASGKWRRACMTSTQLSTYYVGNIEVNDIRRDYQRANGNDGSLLKMHDEMLSFGSPPPRYVRRLMGL